MRAVVRRNKQLVCDEIEELEPAAGQVLAHADGLTALSGEEEGEAHSEALPVDSEAARVRG